jgi:hypothetical protein
MPKGKGYSDNKVGKKISKLVKEGKPQKQAVTIALEMARKKKK